MLGYAAGIWHAAMLLLLRRLNVVDEVSWKMGYVARRQWWEVGRPEQSRCAFPAVQLVRSRKQGKSSSTIRCEATSAEASS